MVQNETEFNHAGKYVSIVKLSTYSCTHVNSYRNTWFKDKLVTPHSRNSNDYCDMIQNTTEHTTNYVTPNIRTSTALLYMHIHPLFVVIQVCVRTHVRNPWNDFNEYYTAISNLYQ